MNQSETGIIKLFMWLAGVLLTSIMVVVTKNYTATLETQMLLAKHTSEERVRDSYINRRLFEDSINIYILKQDNYVLKYWVKRIPQNVFVELSDSIDPDFINYPKLEGNLPKKELTESFFSNQ